MSRKGDEHEQEFTSGVARFFVFSLTTSNIRDMGRNSNASRELHEKHSNIKSHPIPHTPICLVGATGFEPAAFRSQSESSTRLSYTPIRNY